MYLLGFDIGSSSVKAALVNARTGRTAGIVHSPQTEMEMDAPAPGWAEQHPDTWWANCCRASRQLLAETGIAPAEVGAIGISYQMHGLVLTDQLGNVLRPAIIWCDSRAVSIGEAAFQGLGTDYCLQHLLNSPGNFTASKLKWVLDHEPAIYHQSRYMMLPGDYIAFRMTGEVLTTVSGLSEGILWDFKNHEIARKLLDHYGLDPALIPPLTPAFGNQGCLNGIAAEALGLRPGIPVAYRAGDQPNNALSLNVLNPGEVAATGGTSGVVYGILDRLACDPLHRVNSFAHVNHLPGAPRIGVLLCINGAGSQYRWMRKQLAQDGQTYREMELLAATVAVGAGGLCILPFGNGAERMLGNRQTGAQIANLDFNRHTRPHIYRAALEGVAFSFVYGMEILRSLGLQLSVIRVGNDNLFQSGIFAQTIAELLQCQIQMLQTTGAAGAAIGAGAGIGVCANATDGTNALQTVHTYEPHSTNAAYTAAYDRWSALLHQTLTNSPNP
ncbi:MAG: carbohydrate kinase [Saprospirales bacterium]|nr:carbohydrate kinase [Saprospirales bacterium]MBK8921320.1 carbohydrate kinase [Saprospirales bacterium]